MEQSNTNTKEALATEVRAFCYPTKRGSRKIHAVLTAELTAETANYGTQRQTRTE